MCKAAAWAQGLGQLRLLRAWGSGLDFLRPSSGRAKPSRARTSLIKTVYSDIASTSFHYMPFKTFWKDSSTPEMVPQRVYDELYSSNAMIEAHMKLQQQPPELGCTLEHVIASLMLWSDSTHLAKFGTASLWPLYLFFGNQSKSVRGKPKTASCHHVAYIPKVSNGYSMNFIWCGIQLLPDFLDFYVELTGDGPSADVSTHCRRELMHAVWVILLDDEKIRRWFSVCIWTWNHNIMSWLVIVKGYPRVFHISELIGLLLWIFWKF